MNENLQEQFIVAVYVGIDIWVSNFYLNYYVLWFIQLQEGNGNIYTKGDFGRMSIVKCFETCSDRQIFGLCVIELWLENWAEKLRLACITNE